MIVLLFGCVGFQIDRLRFPSQAYLGEASPITWLLKACEAKSIACEFEAFSDVFVFDSKLFFTGQLTDPRQRLRPRMLADERQGTGNNFSRQVGESRPVPLRQTRHLERVAGDHLQVEADLGPGRPQDVRITRGRSRTPVPSGTSASRKPSSYSSTRHVLEVGRERPRRQRLDHLHRVFQQRDAVAGVEADADVVVAELLQDRDQLVGPPVLVVLDGQTSIPSRATTRAASLSECGRRLGEPAERGERREGLVPPAREHHASARPARRRAWPCGSRPRTVRGRPRREEARRFLPDTSMRLACTLAQGVGRGVSQHAEPNLHACGAQRSGIFEESARVPKTDLAAGAAAIAGMFAPGNEWMTSPSELGRRRRHRRPWRCRRRRLPAHAANHRSAGQSHGSSLRSSSASRSASQGDRYGRSSKASASGSSRTASRSASHRSFRPSRSDRFARWQAVATRCALSRSEIGWRRDFTQSRKLRAWRRNWSNSSPERSSTVSVCTCANSASSPRRSPGPPTGCAVRTAG